MLFHKEMKYLLREGVKYYFADFVRKGGTPLPSLFMDFFPGKKGVTDSLKNA